MNRSQYLPYTAYTITPYPPQFGAPGYHNVPAMAPAQTIGSGTPVSYPPPAYNNFAPVQRSQQQPPQQQPHQNLSAWPYGGGYAPMAGQIEDIVSPSPNNMPTPPGHNPVNAIPGQMGSMMHHPASLPQVQDVFAPRQPSTSPFGTPMPNQMTQMSNGTSRMVGAYPPMPPGSQGSSPTIAVPQRPVDPAAILARPRMAAGFPPQQMSMQGGGVGFGGDNTMGMGVQGGNSGYSHFNMSP